MKENNPYQNEEFGDENMKENNPYQNEEFGDECRQYSTTHGQQQRVGTQHKEIPP